MMSPIATTEFDARLPSGELRRIVIKIGAPQQLDDHAECAVVILGIDEKIRTNYGGDTVQALSLALRYARNLLDTAETVWGWTMEIEGQPFPEWRVMFGGSAGCPG
ncbi:MAG: hypothetical protein SH850_04930 [Planctomycetaceae bacterium]|nr:hypothetical protein [Planctomycetaceae bacterium]